MTMKAICRTVSLCALIPLSIACSGGGGGGGGGASGDQKLMELVGKDSGQVLANIGGALSSVPPELPAAANPMRLQGAHPFTISFPGFTADDSGTWTGSVSNGGTTRLQFYDASNALVVTSSAASSFAGVTQIKVLHNISKTFTGGYSLNVEVESDLAAFDPANPLTFPNTLTFGLVSGSESVLSGEFGDLDISTVSFVTNSSGHIVETGTLQAAGTVKTDAGDTALNADIEFSSGGCVEITIRTGLTLGSGTVIGTATVGLTGLEFSFDGEDYTIDRGHSPSGGGSGCTLENINFENYAAIASASTLGEAGDIVGCPHRYEHVDATSSTVRWVLGGAEGVYIQLILNTSGNISDQLINGIFYDTGQPKC